MKRAIDAVRHSLGSFLGGLTSCGQSTWDIRLDFVSHHATDAKKVFLFHQSSLFNQDLLKALYERDALRDRFFTRDLSVFKDALNRLECRRNEASLVALDFCIDFPWRDSVSCHRVVVLISDEPVEHGIAVQWQRDVLPAVSKKICALEIALFIIAPESQLFMELAAVPRCEFYPAEKEGDGLSGMDFQKLMEMIGKSISQRSLQASRENAISALFGQNKWRKEGDSYSPT